jgi:hypothetical protein
MVTNSTKYQQNKQSPLILTELTEQNKRPWHMTLEIYDLAWDRYTQKLGSKWSLLVYASLESL